MDMFGLLVDRIVNKTPPLDVPWLQQRTLDNKNQTNNGNNNNNINQTNNNNNKNSQETKPIKMPIYFPLQVKRNGPKKNKI